MYLDVELIKEKLKGISHSDAVKVQYLLQLCNASGYGRQEDMLDGLALECASRPLDSVLLWYLIAALPHIIKHEAASQASGLR